MIGNSKSVVQIKFHYGNSWLFKWNKTCSIEVNKVKIFVFIDNAIGRKSITGSG